MAAWSPTGDRLVFIRWSRPARSYKFEVVVADATTGAETIIVESTKQGVFYPDWKP
jgi:Tol biopolymer transport system component